MHLLTFEQDGELRLGVKRPGGIFDVRAVASETSTAIPLTMEALLAGGPTAKAALESICCGSSQRPAAR